MGEGKINFLKNRFILNREYCAKKINLSGYPIEITIELTNWCNLDCIFCPHAKMRRPQGFIDLVLFRKIIDDVKGYVEAVDLDLMGESALHPNIYEIISYCKNSGLKVLLNSNMSMIDNNRAKSLIDSGLDMLVMSIDGADKNTYEAIRRGASFDKTKENIEGFLRLAPKKTYSVVQMVCVANNAHQVRQFFASWRHKGADFIRTQPYQNVDKGNLAISPLPLTRKGMKKTCIQPWKKFAICWDGTAVLCCNDYDKFQVIGDARKDNVLRIWNSQEMRHSRQKLIARNFEGLSFCRGCLPFEPSMALFWGSIFVSPIQMRKLLFFFERLMMLHRVYFFRYF